MTSLFYEIVEGLKAGEFLLCPIAISLGGYAVSLDKDQCLELITRIVIILNLARCDRAQAFCTRSVLKMADKGPKLRNCLK
ncbi:hypothetical protein SAMN02746065_1226 [Desulfocicer vacuolatum DSM 3385]|uniref:Uncharacterized protein n=1 Tax=Desulfocicer vacuolatum DSM 3385 TaxID=1121400 RepID=A0A1W2DXT6_9BACT|nr:hypothetical protein SAMN02746065_1226 [Desulfocicer vacuolatum DSM 3385]